MADMGSKLPEVVAAEFATIQGRRKRIGHPYHVKDDVSPLAKAEDEKKEFSPRACRTLIGLALSGGGIRSATTNIGVLQGLSEEGVLRSVDYLSTVSGGGYIGSCLSSLLAPKEIQGDVKFTTTWEHFPFREDRIEGEGPDGNKYGKQQMQHIRTRAGYLAPRAHHLSGTVLRAVGAVLGSTAASLLWFMLLVTIATSAYMLVVAEVAPGLEPPEITAQSGAALISGSSESTTSFLPKEVKEDLRRIFYYAKAPFEKFIEIKWQEAWQPIFVLFAAGVVLFFLSSWLTCTQKLLDTHYGRCMATVFLLLSLVLWCGKEISQLQNIKELAQGAILVLPSLFASGALLGTVVYYCICARLDKQWTIDCRSQLHKMLGILFVFLFVTLLWAVMPGFMMVGADRYTAVLFLLLGAGLRYFLGGAHNDKKEQKKSFTLPAKYTKWLMGFSTWLFVYLAVVLVGNVLSENVLSDAWPAKLIVADHDELWTVFGSAVLLLVLFHVLVDANRISPHYFYRDRLAEAFLETQTLDKTWLRNDTEMRLMALHGNNDEGECAGKGPYLLLNATLNLTASKKLKAFNRKSDIFTLSRHYCGSEETGYIKTAEYIVDGGSMKLARAMTISGAAVTSVMGMNTSLVISFLCTIFGVRLGYWLPNIKRPAGLTQSWTSTPIVMAHKYGAQILRLYKELMGNTTADGMEIYLSDGGHCGDNLGIIPLLRRRVKVLIVSDSECDSQHAFDSFNSSVRNAYVDEGIRIEIDLKGLGNDEKGCSTDKIAVGKIIYPEQGELHGSEANWIIIYKNTITGKEIAPILNYRGKNPEFPHESTADQFFTEEQFESYRALGRFAFKGVFVSLEAWKNACSVSASGNENMCTEAYEFLKKNYQEPSDFQQPSDLQRNYLLPLKSGRRYSQGAR